MSWINPKFILTELGFDNINDLITSVIGFKGNIFAPLAFIFAGGISILIENHMWSNPSEIYFLAILITIDLYTGIWKSIKNKKFKSKSISRTAGKTITYAILLYIAFNMDRNMPTLFFWMPYSILGVFYATEAWSIIENLGEIGYVNNELVKFLKKKLNIKTILNNFKHKNNIDLDNDDSYIHPTRNGALDKEDSHSHPNPNTNIPLNEDVLDDHKD